MNGKKPEMRRYGAGKGIPRFFKSTLFLLILIIVGTFIGSLVLKAWT